MSAGRSSPMTQPVVANDGPATALVIGFGNLDRSDDGIAYHVVNELRKRLGRAPLGEDDTGLEALGWGMDTIFVPQLVPHLINVAALYPKLVFVDAHVYPDNQGLHLAQVSPASGSSPFAHQLTPPFFLALLDSLCRHRPESTAISLRGWSFDFGRTLSTSTEALINPAVESIIRLLLSNPLPPR